MPITRRILLRAAGIAAGAALVPANLAQAAEATPPANGNSTGKKLRLAAIGVGSQGQSDLGALANHKDVQVVAVCDPDRNHREKIAAKHQAKAFADYRNLFKEMADQIDGVLVSTPDHMHAPIALLAMSLGKHVYGQKPLARTIGECRAMARMAAEKKVITQMGIQIHSTQPYQTTRKWVQAGVIGKVRAIHSGIGGKPWGGKIPPKASTPAPESMDWDRYLGVAESLPWRDGDFHQGNWRKWVTFGTGTQGDMGCHVFDPVYMAVGLTFPTSVVSLGPTPPGPEFFSFDCHVQYIFPKTEFSAGDIEVHWRNGNLTAPKGLHPGIEVPASGALLIGDKGALAIPHFGPLPTVVDAAGVPIPKDKLPEPAAGSDHYHDWVEAVLANDQSKASAPFAYGGPMTEAVLMGVVINRWPNKTFTWDGPNCRFIGADKEVEEANRLIQPTYRAGWTAPGIGA